MSNIVEFKCVPERCVYNSENFKIYGVSINPFDYPDIKVNKYNNVTIKGNISELNLGVDYSVKAKEVSDSYGVGYEVLNVKREKPTTLDATKNFLYEILTPNQADTLLAVYPDIVDRVIHNRLDDIDLSKTKGIKEYTFNVIKRKIIENFKLADIVEEFKGLFNMSVVKKLYEKYTSVDKIKEKLREEPYQCLCRLGGIGFKTADSLLLTLDKEAKKCTETGEKPILYFGFDLVTSYQRAKACVDFILDENEMSGNTYMDIWELKRKFDVLVPEAKNNLGVILKGDNDVIFNRNLMCVCRKETYDTEQYVADRLKDAVQINIKWDYDLEQFKKLDGFTLTEEQCKTSKYMCDHNIVLLVGYAGSGKSSSTQAFVNLLDTYHKSYMLLAPTGRAAKVLTGYTGKEAQTIHRGLCYMPPGRWEYNSENKLPHDVIIVDEFSMVDIFLFKHLVEAIDFSRTKLLLIGDDAQIPSVGAGNVLYDLLKWKHVPTVTLNKIFRYGAGGLSSVATDIRQGKEYLDKTKTGIQIFGDDQAYVFVPLDQTKIIDYTVKLYQTLLTKGYSLEDIGVLSCYNVGDYGTIVLNQKLQEVINDTTEYIKFGENEYRLNDIVMNYSNDYKAVLYSEENISKDDKGQEKTFIANGEAGIVKHVNKDNIVVDYDGTLIYYEKGQLKNIKLAYAISTHKSQGGSFKVVIMLTPKSHTFMLNSNLLYVGVSRAKERCYHLGEIRTVNMALKKKENFDRKTLLLTLLNQ